MGVRFGLCAETLNVVNREGGEWMIFLWEARGFRGSGRYGGDDTGVGASAGGVPGVDSVVVAPPGGEVGVSLEGAVGARAGDGVEGFSVGGALDLEAGFVGGVVAPGQVEGVGD